MQLTEHFSLEEFVASETAARRGIDNAPSTEIVTNLRVLAMGLEKVRIALGYRPIHVNSGYRCPALNEAVGGARKGVHMKGLAADILCPQSGSPLEVCRAIHAVGMPIDQIIHEFGKWCHVSFVAPPLQARGQPLTIASARTGYQNGLRRVAWLRSR